MAGLVTVTVDNRLRMPLTSLPKPVVDALRAGFTYDNPEAKKLEAMGRRYHGQPATYELWRNEQVSDRVWEFTLPRGGMDKLRDALNENGLEYEVIDKRSAGDEARIGAKYEDPWGLQAGNIFPEHKKVLWSHQRGIVEAIRQYEQALVRAPTGSGKTTAVLAAIAELQVPALVIMWDTGLLKQWRERIEEELGIPPAQQGLIQGSVCRLRGITLAMQQTFNKWDDRKWEKIRGVFGLVACDEVQRYAATTFTKQIDRLDCKYRIGVSADERRKDRKQFIIYDMFGRVRHEVPKKELIDKRIIHEVEVYVVPTQFTAAWYVDKRDDKQIEAQDFNRLLDEMEGDEKRNKLATHLISECVGAGLPSLAFTHRVDHAMIIDRMVTARGIKSGLALGGPEWSDQFDATIAALRDGTYDVGVGTFGKLGVGHDIPTVAAGVTVTPVHNNKPFMGQVKGRICRTTAGKQNARLIVLWDRLVFGEGPLLNLRRWNEVVRVWCEWDRKWKDINVYMKEHRYGRASGSEAEITEGIFSSAQH